MYASITVRVDVLKACRSMSGHTPGRPSKTACIIPAPYSQDACKAIGRGVPYLQLLCQTRELAGRCPQRCPPHLDLLLEGQSRLQRFRPLFALPRRYAIRLGIPDDADYVNPNGGAIALGHPLGMSGARLVATAARHLKRTGGRYALCTMCVGVGQGFAILIERP